MRLHCSLVGIFVSVLLTGPVYGQETAPEVPPEKLLSIDFMDTAAAAAPEGVLYAQPLRAGQWMVDYRYSRTRLRGNRSGTRNISVDRALRAQSPNFQTVPYKRTLQNHLFSVGWAPFSRLTLIASLPVRLLDQGSKSATGLTQHSKTDGIGDLHLMALIPFMKKGQESLTVNIGFRAPTGSIRDRNTISGAPDPRLGYSMQPGRGSWGFIPGLTYRGHWKGLSWGLQYKSVIWLNTNSLHYRPGTRYGATTWMAWSWADWVSTSFRVGWDKWGNVHGGDREFGRYPYDQPDEDPMRQGGQRVDLAPGVNFRIPCCGGPQLGFEAVFPVWQELSGPQLRNRWMLHTGLRVAF